MITRFKNFFIDLFLVFASFFVKRSENRIAIGSWAGKLYIDNSRYLLEEMLRSLDSSYKFYWIGISEELREKLPNDNRLKLLKINSLSSVLALLKCKYFFCSQFPTIDICLYNVYHGSVITYLTHGFPIKKVGDDKVTNQRKRNYFLANIKKLVFQSKNKYNFFSVSSRIEENILMLSYGNKGCNEESLLRTGTPRNDFLINLSASGRVDVKNRYKKAYGINENKKILLYLPTFRRLSTNTESLYRRSNLTEVKSMSSLLNKYNYVLIEKGHFADHSDGLADLCKDIEHHYLCLGNEVNVQELLACADILISDYSGAFVDFLVMDRPIIHYVYDYDYYKNTDSGLYFSKEEFACGEVAVNYEELLVALESYMKNEDKDKCLRKQKRELFLEYEKGEASEKIIEAVIGNPLKHQ